MTQNEMLRAIFDDMQEVKKDVRGLKGDVQNLKDNVRNLSDKVQRLEEDGETMKGSIRSLQLTLENETNRNIRIIAEGHLDLNRKLDEALKVKSEKEMMNLRVNVLENDMRKVKEKVGIA